MSWWHVPLVAIAVAGCSIDTVGLREGTGVDASPGADTGTGVDARRPGGDGGRDADAARFDGGVDAMVTPDAGTDAGPFDAGSSCEELFGSAAEYALCWETDTTCAFNVRTDGDNCETVCTSFERGCFEGYDNPNPPDDGCAPNMAEGCGHTGRSTELCECER